jgi:hypothetical protein
MSHERRQDLVYPPGPEARREQGKPDHRLDPEAPTITGRLFSQFCFVRHDEEALLRTLRQVPRADRFHARIALFQALGGQYANAGPRALALCERVFGPGTMHFPSEQERVQRKDHSPNALAPSRSAGTAHEPDPALAPEAAFGQGRIQTLCGLLERLVLQAPRPPASQILALLDAAEGHVAKAALRRLRGALLPGEDRYGKTYYQALQQAAGESVSDHLTGRRDEIERMLPGWHKAGRPKNPPPLPPETRVLQHGGWLGTGDLLGSWDQSTTVEARARRHAEAEQRLAEDHPALAALGQGGGEPLPAAVLERMNRLFGHDFSHVRIHEDAAATQAARLLGARALALGTHVYFGAGQFVPGTPAGDRLLAHELLHVVQFDEGRRTAFLGADRAAGVRLAARLYRDGELARALQQGFAGVTEAVAAALHDGAILAPHPADQLRASASALAGDLSRLGRGVAAAAARAWQDSGLAPVGERAFALADGVTGGAARAWGGRARGWADGVTRRAMAFADAAARDGAEDELGQLSASGGLPLPPATRARMEALFGHRFGHVRIHTDAGAAQAAQAVGAQAVTIGSHVYFNRGFFAPGTEAGDRLLLHELTHVVQHDQGRLPPPAGGRVELSSPSDPAEREARSMETRVGEIPQPPSGNTAPQAAAANEAPRAGKRASPNLITWAGEKLDQIENWAEDKIEGLVREVSPGLADLIHQGPGALIKNALEPAISGWVGNITGGVNVTSITSQLKGFFTSAFGLLQGAKEGDPKCCEMLVSGINAVRELAHKFMNNPVMDALKGVFAKVSDIVGTITKLVLGPAFDVLRTVIGGAWDAIKTVASTIQGWFQAVKDVAGKAFDWVAKKLGFSGGTGEGGLLDWLKEKAAQIWEGLKKTLQPVLGPLKVVSGVLLLFTGLPQLYAIIKYGPQVVEAVQWLWANRNNPEAVKKNPKLLGGSILPKILGVGQSFVGMVKSGVAWLVEKTSAFATGALQLLGAITGVPLLQMARGFVQTIVDGVRGLQEWATGAFTSAVSWLEGLFHKIVNFVKPYAEVLCSVAAAIINPASIPLILAGWAWRWLPDCIKPPLIDLLLDAVITVLGAMPDFPLLGPLWSLLKAGVMGFLRALRARDPATKIKVSNTIAKLMSGASPMFLFGFVKGLLKGVWDGIKMPFEAIWLVAKGIEKAGDFFVALGEEAEKKAPQPAAQPNAASPGARPMPSVSMPGVISPNDAPSVVAGITAQLNQQKPVEPTPAPGPSGAQGKNDYRRLGQEARRMKDQLAEPAGKVVSGFWPAVKELFSSGGKTSIDELMAKMGKVWQAAKNAVASLGAKIANMICDFFMKESSEEQLGETVGYMVGMVAFQALLDYLSAGTWTGAMGVLSAIAKFLNWPMEFLGEAMKALKQLGGYILDGLKQLGGMVKEAASSALGEVVAAFREIGTKLREFAEEILAKFRGEAGGAESAAAHAAEGDAAKAVQTAERDAAAAEKEAASVEKTVAEKEAQKAEELVEAEIIATQIARAEDAGHVPGPVIAGSLDALKGRYSWIKLFEARPKAAGYAIYMIASEHHIADVGKSGLLPKEEGPSETAKGTDKIANAASGVKVGEAGQFAALDARAVVGDALTPHHMPQAALGFTSRAEGGALVMTAEEHAMTRTYGALGRATARAEAGLSFREVLARDIRDVRRIVGAKYDEGIRELLRYYRQHFPELLRK